MPQPRTASFSGRRSSTPPTPSPPLDARGRLLRALAANARATLGPVRVDAVRDQQVTRHTPDVRTPRALATLQWLDRLQTVPIVDADKLEPATAVGTVTRSLRAARINVDAATDLALTHYDGPGRLRPDAAPPLAHSNWGALTADCLRLVALAAAIEPLAQRCRQAGLTRTQVDHYLPLHDDLVDRTWTLAASWQFPNSGARDLTVAHPALRTGDPAAEWTDRMTGIHQQMREHHDRGRIGVRTLRDVARLGTVISHVLATSGKEDAAPQSRITTQWQALTEYLAPLRSTEPANDVIRDHVESMLDLASAASTQGASGRATGSSRPSRPPPRSWTTARPSPRRSRRRATTCGFPRGRSGPTCGSCPPPTPGPRGPPRRLIPGHGPFARAVPTAASDCPDRSR